MAMMMMMMITTTTIIIIIIKEKGKVHPRTSDGQPEGEYRYSSPLSLTLAQDEGGWSKTPRPVGMENLIPFET
jgi:hypothetical protein